MVQVFKKLTFIAFGILVVFFVSGQLYTSISKGGLPMDISFKLMALGTLFYFLSHLMRAIRLLILSSVRLLIRTLVRLVIRSLVRLLIRLLVRL